MTALPPNWDDEHKAAEKIAIGFIAVGLLLVLIPGAYLAHALEVFQ